MVASSFARNALSNRYAGTPQRMTPPGSDRSSNTVTANPSFASSAAQERPAGPEPTTATFSFRAGPRDERLEADLPRVLDEEALDLPDGDGPHDARGAALLLAQARRRAQHAAGAAEHVVGLDRADGALDVAQAQLADEGAGVGLRRAPLRAGRVVAEQAAIRLGEGLDQAEALLHGLEPFGDAHPMPPWAGRAARGPRQRTRKDTSIKAAPAICKQKFRLTAARSRSYNRPSPSERSPPCHESSGAATSRRPTRSTRAASPRSRKR